MICSPPSTASPPYCFFVQQSTTMTSSTTMASPLTCSPTTPPPDPLTISPFAPGSPPSLPPPAPLSAPPPQAKPNYDSLRLQIQRLCTFGMRGVTLGFGTDEAVREATDLITKWVEGEEGGALSGGGLPGRGVGG